MRRTVRILATVGLAVATAHLVANTYRFRVERVARRIARLRRPLRLAFLTDLHFGTFLRAGSVAAWVDAALAAEPDVILLGGDLVDGLSRADPDPLLRELARLRAHLGVYATWGNHDYGRFGDVAPFGAALERVGVRVLRNRGTPVRDDLYLAGLDDGSRGEPDLAAALAGRPPGAACVLVAHDPAILSEVPPEVDLTLCGHTHGGQIRLPGIGAVVKASRFAQRFTRGWTHQRALGYVSRGLGVGIVPLRLNCPAELTLLELLPGPTRRA
jgi:uncharacterized protein